ncbi:nuclear transport factor 2 family protein [Salipiger sp. IMCC34102]|uniref:nuclear transport factor 2 family protein n=1 Tax=Salipiger sp. IMCC34102 TaxID=2510647 RepID=UPI00101B7676|nr:nuclear transport factor 2 family protein [Salipiger sp. IMCC34102]RYH00738.1 nuclear transport factor 2 family protein [Salipiger sp. IMCC34102]
MTRMPLPPFSHANAVLKVRMAENAWNGRDPQAVSMAYTLDTRWRNRSTFLTGRAAVVDFLTRKWAAEQQYRLIKEIWTHGDNRIAVRFCYEYHDAAGQWFRAYGNENWAFDAQGYMAERHASINHVPITPADRLFHWPQGPRPNDHPGLSNLGL